MNSLSWFIYLTQVTDSIGTGAAILGGVGLFSFVFVVMAIGWLVEDGKLTKAQAFSYGRTVFFVSVSLLTVSALLPSRQTMLLIAGSEMGERLVKSESVNSVVNPGVDLLKTWIKRETEKLTKEASK